MIMDWTYFLRSRANSPKGVGFSLFDPLHMKWIFAWILVMILASYFYKKGDEGRRCGMRLGIVGFLIFAEIFKTVCLLITKHWEPYYLPFQLCGFGLILEIVHGFLTGKVQSIKFCGASLSGPLTGKVQNDESRKDRLQPIDLQPVDLHGIGLQGDGVQRNDLHSVQGSLNELLGEFLYMVSIPTAAMAVLFPNWTAYPVLNFLHLYSFTTHIMIVTYAVMLTVGGDIVPKWRDIPKVIAIFLPMLVFVYFVNITLDTNFMFLEGVGKTNPLGLFQTWFGNYLYSYPILVIIVPLIMTGLYKGICWIRIK